MQNRQEIKIKLIECASGLEVAASIFKGLSHQNRTDFEHFKANSFPSRQRMHQEFDEDAHWDWLNKEQHMKHWRDAEIWVVECPHATRYQAPLTQGAILFRPDFSQVDMKSRLIKIEFISTAPHNRPHRGQAHGLYRGVGRYLMSVASFAAKLNGGSGELGLYALPDAIKFYEKLGLTQYADLADAQNLPYFEGVIE